MVGLMLGPIPRQTGAATSLIRPDFVGFLPVNLFVGFAVRAQTPFDSFDEPEGDAALLLPGVAADRAFEALPGHPPVLVGDCRFVHVLPFVGWNSVGCRMPSASFAVVAMRSGRSGITTRGLRNSRARTLARVRWLIAHPRAATRAGLPGARLSGSGRLSRSAT